MAIVYAKCANKAYLAESIVRHQVQGTTQIMKIFFMRVLFGIFPDPLFSLGGFAVVRFSRLPPWAVLQISATHM